MRKGKQIVATMALAWLAGASPASTEAADEADEAPETVRLTECETEVELIAIVYVAEEPTQSMALVGAKRGNLVRLGSWVGERQILDINPRTMVLGPIGDACFVRLQDRTTSRPTPRRRRSRRKRRR